MYEMYFTYLCESECDELMVADGGGCLFFRRKQKRKRERKSHFTSAYSLIRSIFG
jgi:hypothetical protein